MLRAFRVQATAVAVVAAALLVSGCGGSGTTDSRPESSARPVTDAASNLQRISGKAATAPPATAVEAIRSVVDGFRQPDPLAIWAALPPGYQQDVNGLLRDFGRQMDPELWERLRTISGKLAELLRDRKHLILAYPPLQDDPLFATGPLKQVAANWHVTVGLLEALSAADLETLKTFEGRNAFAAFDGNDLKRLRQLAVLLPDDNPYSLLDELIAGAELRQLEASGDRARLAITPREGGPREFDLVRVEGRWFPAAWQQTWDAEITAARDKLKAELAPDVLAQKRQAVLPTLTAFEQSLDRLAAATDQQAFYDLLDRKLLPVLSGTPPAVDGVSAPAQPASSSTGGSVTVEFTTRLDERTEDAVSQALVGLCDHPDGIVLPRTGGAATRLKVSPVSDVRAFARRVRFGRVIAIDAERRTITVEVRPPIQPEQ